MLRPFRGQWPQLDASVFVDQSAQVIGDVVIGPESSVWMNCVVRGDVHQIRIGARSNVQDGTVVHVMRGTHATHIGDEVTIGHGALVHGCTIENRVLIGMGAIVLNGAVVGSDSIVAAGTLLTEGMVVPSRSLVMGSPGKVRRVAHRRRGGVHPRLLGPLRGLPARLHGRPAVAHGRAGKRGPRLTPRHSMASSAPARGMRDFLPADVRRRTYAIGVIRGVYERYGFEPLETPAVENIETLLGKYGDEGNQLIFKILKRGEHEASGQADLALRYDLTVPLSRVVAEHRATLPKFFKRYQIQPVWRADRPARGRFREFFQCDVDAMGSTSPVVEAELCAAACEAMQALGFADAVLRLNHRAVLTGVLDVAGVPTEKHGDALVALDKLDKIGLDGVKVEYEKRGLSPAVADTVLGILGSAAVSGAVAADNAVALDRVEAFVAGHEKAVAGIANIREVLALAARTPAAAQLRVDLSLARGLSYYTGCIMEMTVPDLAGSLGGGGRYDDLVGMFLGQQVPAAGFSLGPRAHPRGDGGAGHVPGPHHRHGRRRADRAMERGDRRRCARAGA